MLVRVVKEHVSSGCQRFARPSWEGSTMKRVLINGKTYIILPKRMPFLVVPIHSSDLSPAGKLRTVNYLGNQLLKGRPDPVGVGRHVPFETNIVPVGFVDDRSPFFSFPCQLFPGVASVFSSPGQERQFEAIDSPSFGFFSRFESLRPALGARNTSFHSRLPLLGFFSFLLLLCPGF